MAKKKKNPNAAYAYIGLVISLVACVATGFTGVIQAIIKGGLYTPANPELFPQLIYAGLALILLGLATNGLLDPDSVRRFFTGRQYRYGSNSLILTIAMLGILVVVNYIVYSNPLDWDMQVDMTEDKSNTLAQETLQALATLPDKVTAIGFFSQGYDTTSALELLEDFKVNSSGKFDYQTFDPDQNPVAAREAGITGDGKILLQMGDKKEIVSYADEAEMTQALIRLINPNPRAVYFLVGHGEADIENTETGMSIAKSTLESKNYTVASLNLLAEKEVPEDALSIIIAGPQKPISNNEAKLLKEYVENGGSLIVLQDPTLFTEFGDANDPLADYLTTTWGIQYDNDLIVDLSSGQAQEFIAVSAIANSHPITQNISGNYVVVMQRARSLSIEEGKENITQTPLILTSENSWGETSAANEDGSIALERNDGEDIPGPLNMAVAAENPATNARVVVFGNSLFATDLGFDAYGNGNMFVNSIDWAAEQDNLINITPRESIIRSVRPISGTTNLLIILFVVFILPGLIVAAGIAAWISRRRKG